MAEVAEGAYSRLHLGRVRDSTPFIKGVRALSVTTPTARRLHGTRGLGAAASESLRVTFLKKDKTTLTLRSRFVSGFAQRYQSEFYIPFYFSRIDYLGSGRGNEKIGASKTHGVHLPPSPALLETMRAFAFIFAVAAVGVASAAALLRKEGAAGVLDAKHSAVSKAASYDTMGAGCSKNSECKNNEVCGTGGKCGSCNGDGGKCQRNDQCCSDFSCGGGGKCSSCNGSGGKCGQAADCCSDYTCNTGVCKSCVGVGSKCDSDGDCCSNWCSAHECQST